MNINTATNRISSIKVRKKINITIKYWWLIVISMLLRVLPYIFTKNSAYPDLKRACLFFSYLMLLFVLIRNLRIKGFWIIAAGTLLNFIAILANAGFMPVSPDARLLAGKIPVITQAGTLALTNCGGVILLPEQTKLRFLTDIFPVSSVHAIFSIGDAIIGVGLLVVFVGIIWSAVKKISIPAQE